MRDMELRREDLFAVLDEIRAKNADKDPDKELEYITAVVDAVRQERHDRSQRAAGGGRSCGRA